MNTQPTPRTDANVKRHNLCRLSGNDLVYADFPRQLERELTAVTEQRDEAREMNIGWQNKWQVAVEMAALAQNELTTVTAQRDRLAAALEEIESSNDFQSLTLKS
jgi:hypothetical protein